MNLFLKKYPEYKGRDFYISGESYAGKYLPHFTYNINRYNELQQNLKPEDQIIINLKATFIGDPFVSPVR